MRGRVGHIMAHAVFLGALLIGLALSVPAHAQETPEALTERFKVLLAEKKFPEAVDVMKRVIALAEAQVGPDHPQVGEAIEALAQLYTIMDRHEEVVPLLLRGLAIREKEYGADSPDLDELLGKLATAQATIAKYPEAEQTLMRQIAIREKTKGPDHPDVAEAVGLLGNVMTYRGKHAEAEPLIKRAIAIREKAFGPDHPAVAESLHNLAVLYQNLDRFAEAEPLYRRSLAIQEKQPELDQVKIATTLNTLGQLYFLLSRFDEAEVNFRRSLELFERALGPDARQVAIALSNLSTLFQNQGRTAEAAPLLERAIAILKAKFGPGHFEVGMGLNNLAFIYSSLGRHDDAAGAFQQSVDILGAALGPEHHLVGVALSNLGATFNDRGRFAEAEPILRRGLSVTEKALGAGHVSTSKALGTLGYCLRRQGRFGEARSLLERALTIVRTTLGPDNPDVGYALDALGSLAYEEGDLTRAAEFWRQSTSVFIRKATRGSGDGEEPAPGGIRSQTRAAGYLFQGLVTTSYRLSQQDPSQADALLKEGFGAAQWALSSDTADSLAQMAARGAKGDPALGSLVRERQDLIGEWQARDRALIASVSSAEQRNIEAEEKLRERQKAIDARIAEIDKGLRTDFPEYASLASAAPASVEEVQSYLKPDEALILFLDTYGERPAPEETFIWVVTKDAVRWTRSSLGTEALAREVRALRCGLDEAAWIGSDCGKLLDRPTFGRAPKPLPFDIERAHRLYKALFGELEEAIAGKQLLLVPAGPLTQLPFQVLVKTEPQLKGANASIDWLPRHHALTVLPAVSSLKTLRRTVRASTATKPMVGFGNPLLEGSDARYARSAQAARDYQSCAAPAQQVAAVASEGGIAAIEMKRGLANVGLIKRQPPLPETAEELCAVAQDINADVSEIRLGARATEREVKALSVSGSLADYRIVHFATHGAMAGELKGAAEPGLILTPPTEASEEDDGYLSSSDIASLKLDADWVILSACNTAAGSASGAEALSGIARAFIYAQARALLVSHWAVNSKLTVKLVTAAMRELAHDPAIGRAEALRRAMLELIGNGRSIESHPSYWAPFVVVGEGAR
jgi:CHAT domain-containing protein/tetratricopeptide (TPR) repeat protein